SFSTFFVTTPAPRSSLFPYTTLFRSIRLGAFDETSARTRSPRRSRPAGGRSGTRRQGREGLYPHRRPARPRGRPRPRRQNCRRRDRKSTRLNSSHLVISYAVFCLKKN